MVRTWSADGNLGLRWQVRRDTAFSLPCAYKSGVASDLPPQSTPPCLLGDLFPLVATLTRFQWRPAQMDFNDAMTGSLAARSAGKKLPTRPTMTENINPFAASNGVRRN